MRCGAYLCEITPIMSDCDLDTSAQYDYNIVLHQLSVFVIFAISLLACFAPLLAGKIKGLKIESKFLFYTKHFGTGVLIATAFVHLLPTAFDNLNSPCLSDFFTETFRILPGLISMIFVFAIALIEMLCNSELGHCHRFDINPPDRAMISSDTVEETSTSSTDSPAESDGVFKLLDYEAGTLTEFEASNLRREIMTLTLLELGILFHSCFVGISLSVSTGPTFITLFIALSIHQFFEGLGLGSRIALVKFPKKSIRPWLMAFVYAISTPLGQIVGLKLHDIYNPQSAGALILVGVMNAISSGLLIYSSLVELLAEDFLTPRSHKIMQGKDRVYACIMLAVGALSMSAVGLFA